LPLELVIYNLVVFR